MKKLVIVTHPEIGASNVNKRWLSKIRSLGSGISVHELHRRYRVGDTIDVEFEQNLLLEHDTVIFQFPFYWFSMPPLLKRWLDEILLPGFAYGSTPDERKLTEKKFGAAISAGILEQDYCRDGRYRYTVEELLAPLAATVSYIGGEYLQPFMFYGAEYSPSSADLERSADDYARYLLAI